MRVGRGWEKEAYTYTTYTAHTTHTQPSLRPPPPQQAAEQQQRRAASSSNTQHSGSYILSILHSYSPLLSVCCLSDSAHLHLQINTELSARLGSQSSSFQGLARLISK